jgi:hypothetical protein
MISFAYLMHMLDAFAYARVMFDFGRKPLSEGFEKSITDLRAVAL